MPESLKVPGMGLRASSSFPCGGVVPFRLVLYYRLWLLSCYSLFEGFLTKVYPGVGMVGVEVELCSVEVVL
ncbi:hypothetical protein Taro_024267 [Colocasia esculenta]|uniref:Uncharacterized protein n=1 Tax=Colocasia esculenta TaxID=4460 RepID=A0A843V5Y3_COLES|nr:hypothetical protein [Colocasia esculenta]